MPFGSDKRPSMDNNQLCTYKGRGQPATAHSRSKFRGVAVEQTH